MPSRLVSFTSKSNKCFTSAWHSSKCSRLSISAHNTNLSTQYKNLVPKTWISQREVGKSSRGYQKVWKWSGTSNPWEWGWSAFYRESKKLVIGAVRLDRSDWSTILVRPVWWPPSGPRALYEGNSLNWQIWVRTRTCPVMAGLVRWSSNSNGHIVYRTTLV
jgi:hypothetical protein